LDCLVFGRGGDSVGLDPAYETDGNSFMVCDNIFEALVFYADESTALEPGLAESWDIPRTARPTPFTCARASSSMTAPISMPTRWYFPSAA
jgi:ABC-type transport system substrate-binding protein